MYSRTHIDITNPVVLLALALVISVTLAIGATGWTAGINIVTFVGVGSIIISLMLVRSILPGIVTHQMSLIIGLGWSFWVTSRLLPANYSWLDRWENLIARLQYWYFQATQGGTSYDNLMFIFQMNVIIWGMGYMTIWLLLRSQRVWLALIPGGLVLLINLYYAPNDISLWFLVYLLLALLLVIQFNLSHQEARWQVEGVFFRPDIRFDFLRDGFIFSALVIGLAWFTPPLVNAKTLPILGEFQGAWQDAQREWNRLYADLNYRETSALDSFGSSLTLGGPRYLTDDPVMDVKVQGLGRYWRATIYDEYDGNGWQNTLAESGSFGPDVLVDLPFYEARYIITQTYTFYRDNSTVLYAMSNPIGLDRSARVEFNRIPTAQAVERTIAPIWQTNAPEFEEITYIRSNAVVNRGESYQVRSFSTQASIAQLAESGTDYPTWVMAHYLQLPDNISQRTRDLASSLAAPFADNYNKARAIERFLRDELTYNEQLVQPPANVEKVDYTLFESKEAYCDYYASAMIVMLRSLDIPARFAVGFARGQYDADKGAFHVINADAHSWVEVYFPRYGWIEFEPTSAQPVIIRPTGDDENESAASSTNPFQDFPERDDLLDQFDNTPIDQEFVPQPDTPFFQITVPWFNQSIGVSRTAVVGSGLMVLTLIVLAAGGLFIMLQRQQPGHYRAKTILTLYKRFLRFAKWMGYGIQHTQTPYEHAAMLKQQLPTLQPEVETLTAEYVHHTFGDTPAQTTHTAAGMSSRESGLAWSRLRPAMLKAVIRRFLPSWLGG